MISSSKAEILRSTVHNYEQLRGVLSPIQALSARTILADFIRLLETQFLTRAMIRAPERESYYPLWFLVETERNVFLWRNGLSLCDQDKFEFWVDPAALVEKRLEQLKLLDAENPLTNPSWGLHEGAEQEPTDQETRYLLSFLETLHTAAPHAHALSQVHSIMTREVLSPMRPRVLLPLGRAPQPSLKNTDPLR